VKLCVPEGSLRGLGVEGTEETGREYRPKKGEEKATRETNQQIIWGPSGVQRNKSKKAQSIVRESRRAGPTTVVGTNK